MRRFIALLLLVCTLAACNLTGEETAPEVILTATPETGEVNRNLRIEPVAQTLDDGTLVVTPGTTVTVTWDGLPEGSTPTFQLLNTLADGGVSEIGEGISVEFIVPASIEGGIDAVAELPNGDTISAIPVAIVTPNIFTGDCRYVPAALGPGEILYEQPDANSLQVGPINLEASYFPIDIDSGPNDNDVTIEFYELEELETGIRGWVRSDAGGRLEGDCSELE